MRHTTSAWVVSKSASTYRSLTKSPQRDLTSFSFQLGRLARGRRAAGTRYDGGRCAVSKLRALVNMNKL